MSSRQRARQLDVRRLGRCSRRRFIRCPCAGSNVGAGQLWRDVRRCTRMLHLPRAARGQEQLWRPFDRHVRSTSNKLTALVHRASGRRWAKSRFTHRSRQHSHSRPCRRAFRYCGRSLEARRLSAEPAYLDAIWSGSPPQSTDALGLRLLGSAVVFEEAAQYIEFRIGIFFQ